MAKSLVGTETNDDDKSTPVTPAESGSKSGRRVSSADSINGWANNEIVIGETEQYLENLLEEIRQGRRVGLKGTRVSSLDRYNPT